MNTDETLSPSTPFLVFDERRLEKNIADMQRICDRAGCRLRPHVKTHKSCEIAKKQLAAGCAGITVAKISEAEVMAAAGIDDIFMAYPIVGEDKIARAAELARRIRLILSVDSPGQAAALAKTARDLGAVFEVRIELDLGMGRSGCYPEQLPALAEFVGGLPELRLTGISSYRNMILNGQPSDDRMACGREEGALMASLAAGLRRRGFDVRDVSAGSTATAEPCARSGGVTEVRPGTYVFYDMMQLAKGACCAGQLAAWVETTVVSVKGDLIVADAGIKALGADCRPDGRSILGFGSVPGRPELLLASMTEEHGMLRSASPEHGLRVGDRLRIVPNHVCTAVNQYERAWMLRDGAYRPVRIDARGCSR